MTCPFPPFRARRYCRWITFAAAGFVRWRLRPSCSRRRLTPAGLALAALLLCLAAVGCAPNLGSATDGWVPVAVEEGVVYAVTQRGQVRALNDGREVAGDRWITNIPGENGLGGAYNPPVIGRQHLYVSGIDGVLYALNKHDGSIAWSEPVAADETLPLVSGPALDEAGGIVAVGSEDGGLYAYNALDGEPLEWVPFQTGDEIWSTPAVRDGVAYFGSQDHTIYAVRLSDGEEVWSYRTGGAVVARPLLHKGLVIVGDFDRRLYALDARSGALRWEFEAGSWWWATPVSSGRVIYAPAMDGKVYALDENGALLWEHELGEPIVSSPALLDQTLVVGTAGGALAALRAGESRSRREISTLPIDGAELKTPLYSLNFGEGPARQAAADDNRLNAVYIGSADGKVRRVQVTSRINLRGWCYNTDNEQEAC